MQIKNLKNIGWAILGVCDFFLLFILIELVCLCFFIQYTWGSVSLP